jgi:hypothetical protein
LKINSLNTSVIVILILSLLVGCNGTDRTFVQRQIIENFQIPAGLNTIESHYFRLSDVNLFYNETLKANGFETTSPREVSGLRASIRNRFSGNDLSVIDRISIFVVNKQNRTDRVEIFYNENIPFNQANEIKLLSSISNFYPYIKDGKVDLDVRIQFRGFLPLAAQLNLDMTYLIYVE